MITEPGFHFPLAAASSIMAFAIRSLMLPGNTIEIRYTTHEQFKQETAESQAVIRSGECSPYANIILCAGVTF